MFNLQSDAVRMQRVLKAIRNSVRRKWFRAISNGNSLTQTHAHIDNVNGLQQSQEKL